MMPEELEIIICGAASEGRLKEKKETCQATARQV